ALLAQLAQQVEVLHIARAHLENVRIGGQQRDLSLVHHFADDQQAVAVRRRSNEPQTFFTEALEAIRRAARLESPAPDDPGARFGDDGGDALDLVPRLHAAGAGHDDDAVAANLHIPDPDHRPAGTKAAASQTIGRV